MSRYYEMTVTVNDTASDRKNAIEEAARAEWDFGGCYESQASRCQRRAMSICTSRSAVRSKLTGGYGIKDGKSRRVVALIGRI